MSSSLLGSGMKGRVVCNDCCIHPLDFNLFQKVTDDGRKEGGIPFRGRIRIEGKIRIEGITRASLSEDADKTKRRPGFLMGSSGLEGCAASLEAYSAAGKRKNRPAGTV
ncbi:hypothetical protein ACVNS2_03425 [Paenibacillus caseinilyticus]|uniref:hypothetical protein n=1 Tax=Paenibacillus mucilaginosus TaxID=61624 RepID=UPI000FFF1ADF|nr:hypothetical protein [Paenibacillus mucilaginosus]